MTIQDFPILVCNFHQASSAARLRIPGALEAAGLLFRRATSDAGAAVFAAIPAPC
jgi:hypothetical protein